MRISNEFILRDIAGDRIIIPTGQEAMHFQGLITVNDVGAFLWTKLQENDMTKEALTASVLEEYEVDAQTAEKDVEEFLQIVRNRGMLLDEAER